MCVFDLTHLYVLGAWLQLTEGQRGEVIMEVLRFKPLYRGKALAEKTAANNRYAE